MNLKKRSAIQIATLISIFVFVLLVATAPRIGLTWDEPAYIAASESYIKWYGELFTNPSQALTDESITNAWTINKEHPPLNKVWSGFVWSITKNFTNDLLAHRLGNMVLVAILAGLLYFWIQDSYGQVAGFASVAALLTMPRFFFHAHLSALDVPAAFSAFVVTFLFWKTLDKTGWKWSILLGVVWGLALATKINAAFVIVTFGLWLLIFRREINQFVRLFIMGIIAIPVFFLAWPWLYHHTVERITEYILFITVNHWEIGQYYLGQFFMPPPWHFGFVMLWAVLPITLTILYFTGFISSAIARQDEGVSWLLFLSALTPILAIAIGQSMVYDNERLIMVSFPFLAGLAGVGFAYLASSIEKLSGQLNKPKVVRSGIVLLALIAFAPQIISMIRLYPHLLSYYGESVGGLRGATELGLETTYWCESYQLALPILNEQAQPGDLIWVDPWSHDVMIYYQVHGYLRDDIFIMAPMRVPSVLGADAPMPVSRIMNEADWFVVQSRQTTLGETVENNPMLKIFANQEVVYEHQFDGVTIFALYR
ncbi:MAG: glycosyltransferase family 39 protein [Anaerolineales bacterium]|nr:glycosyltransferase family 39 protein [Anaerolineales bacterium]